jgi:hypothetical protein
MLHIKHLVLDVLKPHEPNIIEFSKQVAALGADCEVETRVTEMDDKTETVEVNIRGFNLELDKIDDAIRSMGGSLHSVDCVTVLNPSQ